MDATKAVNQLLITIVTGGDDLRGGSGANDNASAFINLSNGTRLSFPNINSGAHWNNREACGTTAGPDRNASRRLEGVTLHTQFGGGIGGDNWNVDQVILEATLSQ